MAARAQARAPNLEARATAMVNEAIRDVTIVRPGHCVLMCDGYPTLVLEPDETIALFAQLYGAPGVRVLASVVDTLDEDEAILAAFVEDRVYLGACPTHEMPPGGDA